MTVTRNQQRKALWRDVKKNRALLYLIAPGVLYFVVFHYLPIYGISFAFVDYAPKYGQGVVANYLSSPWIGFKHFIDFFTGPKFFPLLRNTVILGFYSVVFEFRSRFCSPFVSMKYTMPSIVSLLRP